VWAELRALRPLLAAWLLFAIWRSIAVRGIGGYGADTHLRAGLFLVNNVWVYLHFALLPVSDLPLLAAPLQLLETNIVLAALGLAALVAVCWPVRWQLAAALVMVLPALNIPALHRGYLFAAGFAIVVGSTLGAWLTRAPAWVGPRPPLYRIANALRAALLLTLTFALFNAVTTSNLRWQQASDWSKRVLAETAALVPQPEPETRFYYANLPVNYGDVYVFTWGLPQAIQALYNDRSLYAYQAEASPSPGRRRNRLEVDVGDIEAQRDFAQVFLAYQGDAGAGQLIRQMSRNEFIQLVREAK
jgi:hypothetical protein